MVPTVTNQSRVYVFSEATKKRYRLFGWMFIAIGFVAGCFLAFTVLVNSNGRDPLLMLLLVLSISSVPIFEGFIFLRGASRVSLFFSPHTIQTRYLTRSRTIRLADIAGKREMAGLGRMITCLIPRPNSSERPLRLPEDLAYDDNFNAWLASVPDFDALDTRQTVPSV